MVKFSSVNEIILRVLFLANFSLVLILIYTVSRIDYTDHDCFLFAIMSHGEEGVLYGTDDTMPEEDITTPFRGDLCHTLAGKPKLFFIQV